MGINVVEIIGSRQSGRSTKLFESLIDGFKEETNEVTHVVISTDIKMRPTYERAILEGKNPNLITINPLHKTVNYLNGSNTDFVERYDINTIIPILKELDVVHLYIDNLTLKHTEEGVRKILSEIKPDKLTYTGLTYYYALNRKFIKDVLKIKDLKETNFTSIKLVPPATNEEMKFN